MRTRFAALALIHPAGWRAYVAPDGQDLPDNDAAYLTNAPISSHFRVQRGRNVSLVHCPEDARGIHRLRRGQVWVEVAMYYQQFEGKQRDDVTIDGYHARVDSGPAASPSCTGLSAGRHPIEVTAAPTTKTVQPALLYVFACFGPRPTASLAAFRSMLRSARIHTRLDESVSVANAPHCASDDLRVRQRGVEGVNSAEHTVFLAVTNRSTRVCWVRGFARVRLRGTDGGPLPFRYLHVTGGKTRLYLHLSEVAGLGLIAPNCQTKRRTLASNISVTLPAIGRLATAPMSRGSLALCEPGDDIGIEPLSGN